MAVIQFIQAQKFVLAGSGASIGDTTIVLQSMTGIDGSNIVTGDLGTTAFGTLEPGNGTQEEAISFTGVTQNANGTATLTGVKSCLFKAPYTASSGLTKTHAGASTFILSNDAAFYANIMNFVQTSLSSGAVPATTSVNGISKLSVDPVSAPSPIVVGDNDPRMLSPTLASSVAYVTAPGILSMYVGASAPTGWLFCDGSAVSRSTYSALFGVISTTYGAGDNSTTFNVPDLRGRVPVGVGTGTGGGATGIGTPASGSALTQIVLGRWKGEETHTLTIGELAAHTHSLPSASALINAGTNPTSAFQNGSGTSGSAGSDTPHNNIQPVMGVNFIIKT